MLPPLGDVDLAPEVLALKPQLLTVLEADIAFGVLGGLPYAQHVTPH
jgi:hypothetical protein